MYVKLASLPPSPRRGSVSVLVAVCLTLLLAIVAIALDGGILLSERRHAQAVSDAAALAAATDLCLGNPASTAEQSALAEAAANGYANDGQTSVITPNLTDASGAPVHGIWCPPITGDHVGDPHYVEVVVEWNQNRAFSTIFGSGAIPVRARSVAMGMSGPASNAAIIVLDPTSKDALHESGNPTVNVNAPVIVDSSNSAAMGVAGASTFIAPVIDVTGNLSLTGGANLSGAVSTGVTPTPDPLAPLVPPDPTTLTVQSRSPLTLSDGSSHTLSPGVYTGGISISSNTSVALQPGIYYIKGGGLNLSGSANLTGNGVLIYNEPLGASDSISISGQGTVTLSPPTSGPYAGITIFQDRASTIQPAASITGGVGFNITGTFYTPGAQLNITGNSAAALLGSQLITRYLAIGGTANLTVTWDAKKVATRRVIQLVE